MLRLLSDTLIASAENFPEKIAVVCDGVGHTYRQLLNSSKCVAAVLAEKGVNRGARVVIFMNNTWACAVCIYAVQLCDAVFVIVNPQTKSDKLRYLIRDSGATALLTEAVLARTFLPALKSEHLPKAIICSGEVRQESKYEILSFSEIVTQDAPTFSGPKALTIDLAALIYTSGSTGNPKGVMQTHQSMLFAMGSLVEYIRLSEAEKILCVLPLAFDYGLYQLLMSVFLGATLILERSFLYPGQIYNRIKEQEVSVFPGVPTVFSMLIAAHNRNPLCFPSVTRVTNTAAALPTRYVEQLKEIFPNALIFKMYGLTECKRACYLEPELLDKKLASVGKAIPGTEMFLLSEKGEPVESGKTGILHIRGSHVMLGYWQKPDFSKKMLKPGRYPGERILCTHDLFYQDEDGFFYFAGRSDDIIKSRGEKVSPVEIETVLYGIPGVKDAAVVGASDELLGEAVCAFVATDDGEKIDERVIRKVCVQKLEDFMVPKHIFIWDKLPKNTNAKIDKKALMHWAASQASSP